MNGIIEKSNIADTNVMFAEITLCLAAILENVADSTRQSKETEGKAFKKNWVFFQEWLLRSELSELKTNIGIQKYCKEIVESVSLCFSQNFTNYWSCFSKDSLFHSLYFLFYWSNPILNCISYYSFSSQVFYTSLSPFKSNLRSLLCSLNMG